MNAPTVSICVTTYNHEDFIQEAIDSILAQQTNFPIEILIGEDGSDDKTREIVQRYEQQHKNLIRAFYHEDKDKIYINGQKTGRKNLATNLINARGKYIALLDGDDYWLDNNKLQKQVDILENHPEYSICFHNAIHVNRQGEMLDELAVNLHKERYDLDSILAGNPIPTMSAIFRNPYIQSLPDWFYQTDMGDWPLHIISATKGDALYMKEVMAVYRIHDQGRWTDFRKDRVKGMLSQHKVWELLLGNISEQCDIYIYKHLLLSTRQLIKHYYRANQFDAAGNLMAKRVGILKKAGQSIDKFTVKYKIKILLSKLFFTLFKSSK